MNPSRFREENSHGAHTLVARINAGDGKFPFVNVQSSKNHRPIPIEGATYYLRPCNRGSRTPIRIEKDFNEVLAAWLNADSHRSDAAPEYSVQRRFLAGCAPPSENPTMYD